MGLTGTQKQILVPIYSFQYYIFLVTLSEHNDLGPHVHLTPDKGVWWIKNSRYFGICLWWTTFDPPATANALWCCTLDNLTFILCPFQIVDKILFILVLSSTITLFQEKNLFPILWSIFEEFSSEQPAWPHHLCKMMSPWITFFI